MPRLIVGLDENGRRVGVYHPKSKIPDADIDRIRELHALPMDNPQRRGYRALAKMFGTTPDHIRDIVKCFTRYATVMRWKTIRTPDDEPVAQ